MTKLIILHSINLIFKEKILNRLHGATCTSWVIMSHDLLLNFYSRGCVRGQNKKNEKYKDGVGEFNHKIFAIVFPPESTQNLKRTSYLKDFLILLLILNASAPKRFLWKRFLYAMHLIGYLKVWFKFKPIKRKRLKKIN